MALNRGQPLQQDSVKNDDVQQPLHELSLTQRSRSTTTEDDDSLVIGNQRARRLTRHNTCPGAGNRTLPSKQRDQESERRTSEKLS